jgi:hypothetical protein
MSAVSAATDVGVTADRRVTEAEAAAWKRKGRSKVTNHEDLLPGLDGRSSAARRFRDLVSRFVVDMGGFDQCSEIKLGLLRRLAATTVQSELLEAQMVNGEPVDIATLCTLASTSMRLSVRLGLERRPRDALLIDPLEYARRVDAQEDAP